MIRSTGHTKLKNSLKIMKENNKTAIASTSLVQWFTCGCPLHDKDILVARVRCSESVLSQAVLWCCVWCWLSYRRYSFKWTMLRTCSTPFADCIHVWPQTFNQKMLHSHKRGLLGIPCCRPRYLSNLPFLSRMKGFPIAHLLFRRGYRAKQLLEMVPQRYYDCCRGLDTSCLMQNLDIWTMQAKSLLKGENRSLEFSTNGSYTHQCLVSRLITLY